MTLRLIGSAKLKERSRIGIDFETAMWLSCNKPSHFCTNSSGKILSSPTPNIEPRDKSLAFRPKFDSNGLVTAVVIDSTNKDVLMVAHMNAEAIAASQASGIAHFWSRSRRKLWMKGETSGNTLSVDEIRVDCDQDALLVFVQPAGPACHTGERSCFYRTVVGHALVEVKT